uniref:RNase H type-1 domain-containing protein n=1 Tax=Hordeum vulgare subsp. vulgare TaxID=112509 RepID=A0A8I7BFB1_HORVV
MATPADQLGEKLNVDASFSHDDGRAEVGMVLRDQEGVIIFTACHLLRSCPDLLHVELVGCMEGIALALQWTELPLIVERDSLQTVQLIFVSGQDRSQYAMVVSEVRCLMRERERRVTHISRE